MSVQELAEWEEYDALEPIGFLRNDWHVARLMSLYVNSHRGRGQPAHEPSEFMNPWVREDQSTQHVQTDDEMEMVVRALARISK